MAQWLVSLSVQQIAAIGDVVEIHLECELGLLTSIYPGLR